VFWPSQSENDVFRMHVLAVNASQQAFGAAPLGAPVNQPQPTRWLGRADVLGDGKIRD
jgi:hypothetical protein